MTLLLLINLMCACRKKQLQTSYWPKTFERYCTLKERPDYCRNSRVNVEKTAGSEHKTRRLFCKTRQKTSCATLKIYSCCSRRLISVVMNVSYLKDKITEAEIRFDSGVLDYSVRISPCLSNVSHHRKHITETLKRESFSCLSLHNCLSFQCKKKIWNSIKKTAKKN